MFFLHWSGLVWPVNAIWKLWLGLVVLIGNSKQTCFSNWLIMDVLIKHSYYVIDFIVNSYSETSLWYYASNDYPTLYPTAHGHLATTISLPSSSLAQQASLRAPFHRQQQHSASSPNSWRLTITKYTIAIATSDTPLSHFHNSTHMVHFTLTANAHDQWENSRSALP